MSSKSKYNTSKLFESSDEELEAEVCKKKRITKGSLKFDFSTFSPHSSSSTITTGSLPKKVTTPPSKPPTQTETTSFLDTIATPSQKLTTKTIISSTLQRQISSSVDINICTSPTAALNVTSSTNRNETSRGIGIVSKRTTFLMSTPAGSNTSSSSSVADLSRSDSNDDDNEVTVSDDGKNYNMI